MEITTEQLKSLIYTIMKENEDIKAEHDKTTCKYGQFKNVEQAVLAAKKAQSILVSLTLEKRKEILENIRKVSKENVELLSKLAVEETGMGRVEDKTQKHLLVINKTPGIEDIKPEVFTGDTGLTLIERAPFGVIGAIIPSTNPTSTTINNSISMIAAGNSVVFNPHPSAKKCSSKAVELINKACVEAGGPDNIAVVITEPSLESSQEIMNHKDIKMLAVTGGPAIVKLAMKSGKKAIAAGPGNPPVVVDSTCDIKNAAKAIIDGASFDNNVLCIAEKEVFAEDTIFDKLKEEMKNQGAYEISSSKLDELIKIMILNLEKENEEPIINRNLVGRTPKDILKHVALDIDYSVKLIICEVPKNHPLVYAEQLMPVMPLVRTNSVEEAIDLAYKAENGNHHTAIMHSKNVDNLTKMARLLDTTIFVKNAPSYAGLGFMGEGFTTLTIATPTGEGLTSAKTFTRIRRCVLKDQFRII